MTFDNFKFYVQRNLPTISDIELVAVFLGIDLQS